MRALVVLIVAAASLSGCTEACLFRAAPSFVVNAANEHGDLTMDIVIQRDGGVIAEKRIPPRAPLQEVGSFRGAGVYQVAAVLGEARESVDFVQQDCARNTHALSFQGTADGPIVAGHTIE